MFKMPEPIILAAAILMLALGCFGLAYYYPSAWADLIAITTAQTKGEGSKSMKPADVEASLTPWNNPASWQEPSDHHRLFHSDSYIFFPSLFPDGNYVQRMDKDIRMPSGVLVSWYQKYGLDIADPNVDREDPDNDGFSNLAEFKNEPVGVRLKAADCDGTKSMDPTDPKSHPSFLSRLRLQKYEIRPFHIQFKGYQQLNGQYLFQIHLNDVASYNQPPLKKTGDQLGFEGYIIGEFKQGFEMRKDPGTGLMVNTDVSTIELDKPEIDLKVIVPFRAEIDSPESTADFVMLMPADVDKVIKVSRGKIFTIGEIPDASYLVIDANDTGAVVRDTKTKQQYSIPKLDDKEWDDVPQPVQGNTPKGP